MTRSTNLKYYESKAVRRHHGIGSRYTLTASLRVN
nr:MAG TPA: hypothetical protein [Caudoviricetes sp.]